MWGIGIMYIIMGATPLIVKRVDGKLAPAAIPIYKKMRWCGGYILLLSLIALFLKEPYSIIIPVIPVLILALWMITFTNKLFRES